MTTTPTEIAIRRSFLICRRESRIPDPRLRLAQLNYARLFVRDYWTMFSIARELNCSVSDLKQDERDDGSRKWPLIIQSADEILESIRTLPVILRSLVEARGRGDSWQKIQRLNKDRIAFSLRDDYRRALALVERGATDAVRFLSQDENFFVARKKI